MVDKCPPHVPSHHVRVVQLPKPLVGVPAMYDTDFRRALITILLSDGNLCHCHYVDDAFILFNYICHITYGYNINCSLCKSLMVLIVLIRIKIVALLSNLGAAKVKTLDMKRS